MGEQFWGACVLWVIACTRILDLAGALLDLDSTKHLLDSVFSLCLPSRDFFQPFFRLFFASMVLFQVSVRE